MQTLAGECIVGVDLGATSLRVARVDTSDGEFLSMPTPSAMEAEEVVSSALRRVCRGMRVRCAGLSRAPGIEQAGRIGAWPSRREWAGLPFLAWLGCGTQAPVITADDGVCISMWEHGSCSTAPQSEVTACLGIGTGLAVGIMSGNHPLPVGEGAATAAHECFGGLDFVCPCGKRGCLQTALSVEGLERMTSSGKIEDLRIAFYEFVRTLRLRYGVSLTIITGGGVDRFGPAFLKRTLMDGAVAAGMRFEVSSTPSLSGVGGALMLAAGHFPETAGFWIERARNFIQHENKKIRPLELAIAIPASA